MPRPKKCRRVCHMPDSQSFGPLDRDLNGRQTIAMAVDEFETIRLIDLEGLSQEECAKQMDVARTTAQSIYNSARIKLAECLVKGSKLSISGGEYTLCDGEAFGFGCGHCHHGRPHHGDAESYWARLPDKQTTISEEK